MHSGLYPATLTFMSKSAAAPHATVFFGELKDLTIRWDTECYRLSFEL